MTDEREKWMNMLEEDYTYIKKNMQHFSYEHIKRAVKRLNSRIELFFQESGPSEILSEIKKELPKIPAEREAMGNLKSDDHEDIKWKREFAKQDEELKKLLRNSKMTKTPPYFWDDKGRYWMID